MTTSNVPVPVLQRVTQIVLIITSICFTLALAPIAGAMMMSPMAFDSGATAQAWLMVGGIWTLPIAIFASMIVSWVLYKKRRYGWALGFIALPFLHVALVGLAFYLLPSGT